MLLGLDPVLGPDLLYALAACSVMQVVGEPGAIPQTGERRFYGKVLLTKGVFAPEVRP